jgi:hypothetical protein
MATGEDWSRFEVEACVAEYLHMLTMQLNGQAFVKSKRILALMQRLDGRSKASVEYKFRNISAVMLELGWPTVGGYKALQNYQLLLHEVVEAQLQGNRNLQAATEHAVHQPAVPMELGALHKVWVDPPRPARIRDQPSPDYAPRFSPAKRDYLAMESRNRSLGAAGEDFVVKLEVKRLHDLGQPSLANRVDHVSQTKGDGLGYDVHSFEESGEPRLIEVKTTSFDEFTPFYVSRNEVARSQQDADCYQLYRVFDFRQQPKLFTLPGRIEDHCHLLPINFMAQLQG